MTQVGFRRAIIQFLDEKLVPVVGERHVIEGKQDEGATSSFEITGISPEAIKVFGSDIPYFISQEGVGDVAATISLLDLPHELDHKVLGREKNANGVYHAGESTRPPYCAILFESSDLRGQKIGTGLYAGKFGRGTVGSASKEGTPPTPEADQYSFAPTAKQIEGKNETVGFAHSDDEYSALFEELFGEAPDTSGSGSDTGDATGE
ncbi:major tail protein [Marinilactibacillus sp. XAAS-LB27]|uniref:major tail protein n=1 Tax=Marinilactibacillus sp. XAAS-LB27 TaxID=3114538 RepID=UPI002E19EE7D|nr:major tail protein [Marinilactibacillus sp. XAAS-LB27]